MLCSTSSPQFSSLMCAKKIQKLLLRTIKCQVEFEYLLKARIILYVIGTVAYLRFVTILSSIYLCCCSSYNSHSIMHIFQGCNLEYFYDVYAFKVMALIGIISTSP